MSCACACCRALLAERREPGGGGTRVTPSQVRMSEKAVVFGGGGRVRKEDPP